MYADKQEKSDIFGLIFSNGNSKSNDVTNPCKNIYFNNGKTILQLYLFKKVTTSKESI